MMPRLADRRMLAAQRRSASASLLISEVDRAGYAVQQALAVIAAELTLSALGLAALIMSPRIALGAALPLGLDTPLGDGGRTLSGGERQRLMLARTLLRRPTLLILDEATNALGPANETLIVQALERLKGTLTIAVIAHRGALSALADRAYRLEAGHLLS